jgi:hypothetical protein
MSSPTQKTMRAANQCSARRVSLWHNLKFGKRP